MAHSIVRLTKPAERQNCHQASPWPTLIAP